MATRKYALPKGVTLITSTRDACGGRVNWSLGSKVTQRKVILATWAAVGGGTLADVYANILRAYVGGLLNLPPSTCARWFGDRAAAKRLPTTIGQIAGWVRTNVSHPSRDALDTPTIHDGGTTAGSGWIVWYARHYHGACPDGHATGYVPDPQFGSGSVAASRFFMVGPDRAAAAAWLVDVIKRAKSAG